MSIKLNIHISMTETSTVHYSETA